MFTQSILLYPLIFYFDANTANDRPIANITTDKTNSTDHFMCTYPSCLRCRSTLYTNTQYC